MSKFPIYIRISIGIVAIAGLCIGCQQTPSPNPKAPSLASTSTNPDINTKAIDYLRSQLNLSPNLAIAAESQKPQTTNINDLCQTTPPTQSGWEVALIAEDTRYILQTNQDASKIEICRSEDAQPVSTGKYMGAGYQLRYPADWKAIDLGLELSGASAVIFTPNRNLNLNSEINLEKLRQILHQNQQAYTLVLRQPINGKTDRSAITSAESSNAKDNAKDVVTIPFDAKVKGAKAGSKREYTLAIANPSNPNSSSSLWQIKVLALETEQFTYIVSYYQPKASSDNNSQKIFEQFANSFALIQSPEAEKR